MTVRRIAAGMLVLLVGALIWWAWSEQPAISSGAHAPAFAQVNDVRSLSGTEPGFSTTSLPAQSRKWSEREVLGGSFSPVVFNGPPEIAGSVIREELTPEELRAPNGFTIALPVRNFAELSARVSRGEVIPIPELKERYLPLPESWRKVAAWASSEGLQVKETDGINLAVTASGTVEQVATTLRTRFARVRGTDGEEYTSAVAAPSVPTILRKEIGSIGELQPHLRPLPCSTPLIDQTTNGFVLPKTFASWYNALDLGLDGTGQTIVILGGPVEVDPTDLIYFWEISGLSTTIAQCEIVENLTPGVVKGAGAGEITMDIQWASAMAPGAKVVYLTTMGAPIYTDWILTEIAKGRRIGQASMSYGLPEAMYRDDPLLSGPHATENECLAVLAAAGVSVFASSGNHGSNTGIANHGWQQAGYRSNGVDAVQFPASSPFVTAVGGTSFQFELEWSPNGYLAAPPVREGGWTLPMNGDNIEGVPASAGGMSRVYARPPWQTGPGILPGYRRCIPDVAAVAYSSVPILTRFLGHDRSAGGTSLAAPIWAGICALVNQAREQQGKSTIGLLGPHIYPLNGTASFNQITVGGSPFFPLVPDANNGLYKVGPNYTMVTGLGSPNVGKLVEVLKSVEVVSGPAPTREPPQYFIPERPTYFDGEAYLAHNPDVAAGLADVVDRDQSAWEHYWQFGMLEGRTDGDFNVLEYGARYPDLAAYYVGDLRDLALHWYLLGRSEERMIPVGFSVAGYFLRNSDIAAIFANDKYGAWLHYYNYGIFEGRSFDANFIVEEYLELNPDLKAAFGTNKQAALMHWLTWGHPLEDRMGRVPIGFNVDSYLARYPDLLTAFGSITPTAVRNVTVWHHYIEYGTLEGRTDGDFEAYNYLATNSDLAAAIGNDVRAAALHWFFYGRREGRRIPAGFDVTDYRARYPDIVVGLGDDLYGSWLHYRDTGVNEGRIFGELFRPADYLALNPDVAAAIGNNYRDALLHWLYFGQFEERVGRF